MWYADGTRALPCKQCPGEGGTSAGGEAALKLQLLAGGARARASSPGTVRNARAGGLELGWSFRAEQSRAGGDGAKDAQGLLRHGWAATGGRSTEKSEGWLRTGSAVRGSAVVAAGSTGTEQ